MENVCRLCANEKLPDELTCSIDDQALNIEQKLIECCRWNALITNEYDGFPRRVCFVCYQQLENCWSFAESVAQAQQQLLEYTANIKPTNVVQMEGIVISNTDELNEDSKNEVQSSLDLLDFSPKYENDFAEPILDEDNDKKPNLDNIVIHERRKIFSHFDIMALLTNNDKNSDGSVSQEAISKLNLDDWSILKLHCYVCNELFENHRSLRSHFSRNHSNQTLRILCTICNSSFSKKRSVYRHIISSHRPYLKFWLVSM